MSEAREKESKLRVLICGAGNRPFPKNPATSLFRGWFETIQKSQRFRVVGVQDVSPASLERVRRDYPLDGIPSYLDLTEALDKASCDVVLVCPVVEAHASAVLTAMRVGCHVLIEKPMVARLEEAFQIQRAAKEKGVVVSVIQNWRAKSVGVALRDAIGSGKIGRVGNIFFRYVRDREQPYLPSYLFEEPFPLLYAMSIHHFDLFRYSLGENIVTVEGKGFIPPWSRYRSPPSVHLWMITEGGIIISYTGTFCSKNRHVPQESFVIDGSLGTLTNDSHWGEPPLLFSGVNGEGVQDLTAGASTDVRDQYNYADERYLEDFYEAVRLGRPPLCSPEDNIWTLATVEAAARACQTGSPVDVRLLVEEQSASAPDGGF